MSYSRDKTLFYTNFYRTPCALSDDCARERGGGLLVADTDGPGGQVIPAPVVRGDHLFPIWMVRDDWGGGVGGRGTISVQGGLLVAGTDGPGGDSLFYS